MSGLPFSHHVKGWMTHRPFLDLYKKNTNTNDMSFRTIKNTSYVGVLFDDRRGRWKIKIESFFYLKTHFKLFLLENTNKNLISQYLNQNTLKLIIKTQNLTKEKFYFSTLIYFFRKINDKKKRHINRTLLIK